MELTNVQTVTNEAGEPTAVLVPIDVWRDVQARLNGLPEQASVDWERLRAAGATDAYVTLDEAKRCLGLDDDVSAPTGDGA